MKPLTSHMICLTAGLAIGAAGASFLSGQFNTAAPPLPTAPRPATCDVRDETRQGWLVVERGQSFTGRVRTVHDGDTLRLEVNCVGVSIRLYGIDAPELDQTCRNTQGRVLPCGTLSRENLEFIVESRELTCTARDQNQGRTVAICHLDDQDIAGSMVRKGWARAYREYGGRMYSEQEAAARAERAGIWSTDMRNPAECRTRGRAPKPDDC